MSTSYGSCQSVAMVSPFSTTVAMFPTLPRFSLYEAFFEGLAFILNSLQYTAVPEKYFMPASSDSVYEMRRGNIASAGAPSSSSKFTVQLSSKFITSFPNKSSVAFRKMSSSFTITRNTASCGFSFKFTVVRPMSVLYATFSLRASSGCHICGSKPWAFTLTFVSIALSDALEIQ